MKVNQKILTQWCPPAAIKIRGDWYLVPGYFKIPSGEDPDHYIEVYFILWKKLKDQERKKALKTEWEVLSSDGLKYYKVKFENNDYTCTCPGFNFRGNCKHIDHISRRYKLR